MTISKSFIAILISVCVLMISHVPNAYSGSVTSALRLVELLNLEAQLQKNIVTAVERARSSMLQRGAPAAQVERIVNALKAEMLSSTPDLMEDIIAIYAEEFSEEELQNLIQFYESPTGQKYTNTQSALNQRQQDALQQWLGGVQQRATERLNESQV